MADSGAPDPTIGDEGMRASARVALGVFYGLYAIAGIGWFVAMPGGFPLLHSRFWTNSVFPVAVIVVAAVAITGLYRRRYRFAHACLVGSCVLCASGAVLWWIVFPSSAMAVAAGGLAVALVQARSALKSWRALRGDVVARVAAAAAGFIAALFLVIAQRAPSPDTRPVGGQLNDVPADAVDRDATEQVVLGERVGISPAREALQVRGASVSMVVLPLLTFRSRSPDRCWTVLAPGRYHNPWTRHVARVAARGTEAWVTYAGRFEASMAVAAGKDGVVHIDAITRVEDDTFSHLNSLAVVQVSSRERTALSFSPCPDAVVDVMPFDYPVGRPSRCAYLDAEGMFHVVEASSGEKGPFSEFARGALSRDEPLVVTVHVNGAPAASITLHDWAAQAGVQLSPTAGWGLPVNAIEFCSLDSARLMQSMIYVTLAGTSVGRGFDSVGHARGSYRNRMDIELAD